MMSENQTNPQTESLKSVPLTPSGMHLLAMLMEAFESTLKAMVDKRVHEIMENVATAKLMGTGFDERVRTIVDAAIDEHTADENHHDIDGAVRDAIDELGLDDKIEHAFRHNVNWEDMVSDLVKEEIEDRLPSDDEMHDKVREVLNDITFTVTGTVSAE
jgi:PhoPQ-activated pathogenicity-related protein